jgi:gluconolactonase
MTIRLSRFYGMLTAALAVLVFAGGKVWSEGDVRFTAGNDEFYAIFSEKPDVRIVVDDSDGKGKLRMTEGPTWLDGTLYFSDQPGGLHALHPDGSWRLINTDGWTCGTAPLGNGNLAVCYVVSPSIVEMTPGGAIVRTLVDGYDGSPLFGNPNDIVADGRGGLYFTVTSFFQKDAVKTTGVFYRSAAGVLKLVVDRNTYSMPNGCGLSPDGKRFYLSDSGSTTVWAYDVADDGGLTNGKPFATLEMTADDREKGITRSSADGMAVDRNGNVYVTCKSGVNVFNSSGDKLGIIGFPENPSNCVFGGEDLKTLYVTCRKRIYAIRTNIPGISLP